MPSPAALLLLLLSFLAASPAGCAGLRITDVTFPSYVMLDQTVTLVCDYRVSEVGCNSRATWFAFTDNYCSR